MVKALVTGANGFIGSHVVKALVAQGDDVTCLVRNTSRLDSLPKAGVRLVYGDVTDRESLAPAVAGQDVVYHVAGCTRSIDPRQFYRVNQRGVANIAQTCAAQATPPVLVTVSSLAAVGPAVDGRPRIEADRPAPVSHYGHSKRAGERAAETFADRVPITIVRPPMVLGEADRMGLPLFRSIARLRVHMVPSLEKRRFSVIHADDLAQLLMLAARQGKRLPAHRHNGDRSPQGYYFAASEVDPAYSDLGRMVAKAIGRRVVVVIPTATPLLWVVAFTGQVISRVRHDPVYLTLDKAREITAGSWLCSAQAAAADLGFRVGAPLPERLRQTAEWYRRERWL